MKILHLINVHHWTGPADYVIRNCKYLLNKNVNVLVGYRSFYKGNFREELEKNSIPFTDKIKFPRGFKPFVFYRDFITLKKTIKEFAPNIVHCHNSLENIHCALLKSEKLKFKLVRTVYNSKSVKKKFLSGYLLNSNDFLITVCSDFQKKLVENQQISGDKIRVIKGFVDTKNFFPKHFPDKPKDYFLTNYNLPKTNIKIVMVARFQEQRGHRYLIEAFKILREKGYSNINLVLTGRGETLPEMKELCKKAGIEDFVIFTGYVKEELPLLLQSSDIFVLLKEGSDGTCRAVLEAISSGLPVVTVKKGALTDTIKENVNGFFIKEKEDVNALSTYLKELIDDKGLREYMGNMSRKIAENEFSMDKQLEKYYEFYTEISGVIR